LEEIRSIKTESETFLCHFIGNVNYRGPASSPPYIQCIYTAKAAPAYRMYEEDISGIYEAGAISRPDNLQATVIDDKVVIKNAKKN
jgi:hypothetical protein